MSNPRIQTLIDVALVYGLFTIIVTVVGLVASALLPARPGTEIAPDAASLFVNVWSRWDSGWYMDIAANGYTLQSAAFFPLYPALIAALSRLGLPPTLAGLLIARLAFLIALAGLYDLVRTEYDRTIAFKTILYLALFPTAMFFAAAYTESLYLMLVVLSFRYALKRNWFWASVSAGLAALTRNLGVLLILPLAFEYIRERQAARSTIGPSVLNLLLIPAALGLFMFHLQSRLENPLAFMSAQSDPAWGRQFTVPIYSILVNMQLTQGLSLPDTIYHTAETLTAIMFLALLTGNIFSRMRGSFVIYFGIGLLVALATISYPSGTAPGLYSVPRYAEVLFPAFVYLATKYKSPIFHTAYLAISPALLGLCVALFVNFYWVA